MDTTLYMHLISFFRNGCKPFVEVFVDGVKEYTSITQATMDQIRSFTFADRAVQVPLDATVKGNIDIVVHHVKSVPSNPNPDSVSMHDLMLEKTGATHSSACTVQCTL